MSITDTQIMLSRLGELTRPFTVVTAYLKSPNKNPADFIFQLDAALSDGTLQSRRPKTIIKQLNATWGQCVTQDPNLVDAPSVIPHTFLCAINQRQDLWTAQLTLGNGSRK